MMGCMHIHNLTNSKNDDSPFLSRKVIVVSGLNHSFRLAARLKQKLLRKVMTVDTMK